MAELSEALARAIDGRARNLAAEGAAPASRAARRLAARGRLRGVGVVVAAAGLFTAGTWWQGADETATFDPDPSPSLDGMGTVTVPLDADAWEGYTWVPTLECGDVVPEPNVAERGFTLEVTATTTGQGSEDAPTITSALTHDGEAYESALITDFDTFVIQDGKVVALLWSHTGSWGAPLTDIAPEDRIEGGSFTLGNWNAASLSPCDFDGWGPDELMLAAGEYEVVVVKRVRHTAALLALLDLEASGHTLGGSGWGLWEPGSIDCREAIAMDIEWSTNQVPVQCEPFGVEGLAIDAEAGTVFLPYRERPGALDLDMTLVSKPVKWTLRQDITGAELGQTSAQPLESQPPTCGQVLNYWAFGGIGGTSPATTLDELLAPGGMPIALDVRYASDVQRGTVTLGTPTGAWIVWFSDQGMELVGTATASFAPSRDLVLDRAKDYMRPRLELSDFAACDGVPERLDVRGHQVYVLIKSKVVIIGDDGGRDTVDFVEIALGDER